MIDITDADSILGVKYPFDLVSKTNYIKEFRKIISKWHPDRCSHPKANDVTIHLNYLHEMAEVMSNETTTTIKTIKFGKIEFEYLSKFPFTLGTMYCNTNRVLFEIPPSYKDLCDIYVNNVRKIKPLIHDKDEYEYFLKFIPVVEHVVHDSSNYILIKIFENFIPLRSVLAYFGGRIDNVHVAWIINRMLAAAAYCEKHDIVNNSFTLDSFFIDPETHYGFDQAGWFFSTKRDGFLTALPSENIDIYPKKALQDKKSDGRIDVIAIKRTAALISGDPTGTGRKLPKDVPNSLKEWILTPPKDSSIKEHMYWEKQVIQQAFGKRKFSEWGINSKLILTTRG